MTTAAVKRQLKVILGPKVLGVTTTKVGDVNRGTLIQLLANDEAIVSALTDLYGTAAESCPSDMNCYPKDPAVGDIWWVVQHWLNAGNTKKAAVSNFISTMFASKAWKMLTNSGRSNEIRLRKKFSMTPAGPKFVEKKPMRGGQSYLTQPTPSATMTRHEREKHGSALVVSNLSPGQGKGDIEPPTNPDYLTINESLPEEMDFVEEMGNDARATPDEEMKHDTIQPKRGVGKDMRLLKKSPMQKTPGYNARGGYLPPVPEFATLKEAKQSRDEAMAEAADSQNTTSRGTVTQAGQEQLNETAYSTSGQGTGGKTTMGGVPGTTVHPAPGAQKPTKIEDTKKMMKNENKDSVDPENSRAALSTIEDAEEEVESGDENEIKAGETPLTKQINETSRRIAQMPKSETSTPATGRRTMKVKKRKLKSGTRKGTPPKQEESEEPSSRRHIRFQEPSNPPAKGTRSRTSSSSDPNRNQSGSLLETGTGGKQIGGIVGRIIGGVAGAHLLEPEIPYVGKIIKDVYDTGKDVVEHISGKEEERRKDAIKLEGEGTPHTETAEVETGSSTSSSTSASEPSTKKGKKMHLMGTNNDLGFGGNSGFTAGGLQSQEQRGAEKNWRSNFKEHTEEALARAAREKKVKAFKEKEAAAAKQAEREKQDAEYRKRTAASQATNQTALQPTSTSSSTATTTNTTAASPSSLVETTAHTAVTQPSSSSTSSGSTTSQEKKVEPDLWKKDWIWIKLGDRMLRLRHLKKQNDDAKQAKADAKTTEEIEKATLAMAHTAEAARQTDIDARNDYEALSRKYSDFATTFSHEDYKTFAKAAQEGSVVLHDDSVDGFYGAPGDYKKMNARDEWYAKNRGIGDGVIKIDAPEETKSDGGPRPPGAVPDPEPVEEEEEEDDGSGADYKHGTGRGAPYPKMPKDYKFPAGGDGKGGGGSKVDSNSYSYPPPNPNPAISAGATNTFQPSQPVPTPSSKAQFEGGNAKAASYDTGFGRTGTTAAGAIDEKTGQSIQRQEGVTFGDSNKVQYAEEAPYMPTLRLFFTEGNANIVSKVNDNPRAKEMNRLVWREMDNYDWEANEEDDNPLHDMNIIDEGRRFYAPLRGEDKMEQKNKWAIQQSYDEINQVFSIPQNVEIDGDALILDTRGGGNLTTQNADETDSQFHNVYMPSWMEIPRDSPWNRFTQVEGSQLPDSMISNPNRFAPNDAPALRFQNSFITSTYA